MDSKKLIAIVAEVVLPYGVNVPWKLRKDYTLSLTWTDGPSEQKIAQELEQRFKCVGISSYCSPITPGSISVHDGNIVILLIRNISRPFLEEIVASSSYPDAVIRGTQEDAFVQGKYEIKENIARLINSTSR